jgi:metal-responsive CopG/Arc/MetJ family transcriptional regulator
MPTEKPRYTVIVDEELLKEIDDFRFENRYPSRSAATLELIRLGMEALKKEQKKAQKKKPDATEEAGK